jgi:hypothetical protein
MHLPHHRPIRCSAFGVRCSVFLFSLFLLTTPPGFGQSETNALPKLLPAYAPMPPTFWEQHRMAVLAGGLILLALAAVVIWKILNPGPQPVLPPAIAAREALAKCRARPEDGKVLSEVLQALRRYVSAVFEFPPGERTTAEFCDELKRNEKITPQLTGEISDFLRACDERKFSPANSSAVLNAADRALEFIDLIEQKTREAEDACATKNERRV